MRGKVSETTRIIANKIFHGTFSQFGLCTKVEKYFDNRAYEGSEERMCTRL